MSTSHKRTNENKGFSKKNNLNFYVFVTQSYHMASEDLEYSAQVWLCGNST